MQTYRSVDARPVHPHVQVDGAGRPSTAGLPCSCSCLAPAPAPCHQTILMHHVHDNPTVYEAPLIWPYTSIPTVPIRPAFQLHLNCIYASKLVLLCSHVPVLRACVVLLTSSTSSPALQLSQSILHSNCIQTVFMPPSLCPCAPVLLCSEPVLFCSLALLLTSSSAHSDVTCTPARLFYCPTTHPLTYSHAPVSNANLQPP